MKYICAIDPANEKSAYVICGAYDLKPICLGKNTNELMYCEIGEHIGNLCYESGRMFGNVDFVIVIEDIENLGGIVGRSVFDTCKWIGKLEDRFTRAGYQVEMVRRSQERKIICPGVYHAKDANIRAALVERFAPYEFNYGKGTKKVPGWFYGFRADIWQAYAVAVTYHDLKESGEI